MRIAMYILIGLALSTALPARGSEGFDRYRIIVERKPFGEPPPVQEVPPPPMEEAPPWAEEYRLCSVYEAEGKSIRVGLLETKTNKALILGLGESQNGILLLSADVVEESAVLTKDGQQVTMKLESSGTRARAAAPAQARPGAQPNISPPRPPNQPPRGPRGIMRTQR